MPLSGQTMSVTNTYTPGAVVTASGFNTNFTDFATSLTTIYSANVGTTYVSGAVLDFNAGDVTITHSSGVLTFAGASGGVKFDGPIVPAANDGSSLGTGSLGFSDFFLASGGTINFNNGDVVITHSADALAFTGGIAYFFGATIAPTPTGSGALGAPANQWSDLFLVEGGQINWDNGDFTLIQTGNTLAVAGGQITFAATAAGFASFNLPAGTAPSSPVDGDVWREDNTNTGLKIRVNGVTKTITLS